MASILIIEDNATMRDGMVQLLEREGYDVLAASSGKQGIALFEESDADFVITDLKMAEMDGIGVLGEIRQRSREVPIMIITAFGSIETAVEAMKIGAFDFITKPFPPDLLRFKVKQAITMVQMRRENRFLRDESQGKFHNHSVGESKSWKEVNEQILRVSPTDATVLILGESGTGKELAAHAIHQHSPRSKKPFIKVDCAALAQGVLESELFGHERGSFTGASQRRLGRFELADGGTLFLDEIGEIPESVQVRLLRVLQDRSFERVGGTRTIHIDVRILSATNRDLESEVRKGRFREDLFYRLNIVPIEMPPLRKRREDIPLLAQFFLERLNRRANRKISLSDDTMQIMMAYQWPGNIRELENLIERTFVLARGEKIMPEDLPSNLKISNHPINLEKAGVSVSLPEALENLERQLILKAYREANGVKTKTAEILGIKPTALHYKLDKYGIK